MNYAIFGLTEKELDLLNDVFYTTINAINDIIDKEKQEVDLDQEDASDEVEFEITGLSASQQRLIYNMLSEYVVIKGNFESKAIESIKRKMLD